MVSLRLSTTELKLIELAHLVDIEWNGNSTKNFEGPNLFSFDRHRFADVFADIGIQM